MTRPSQWLSVCAFFTLLLGVGALVAIYRLKHTPPDLDELKGRMAAAEEIICDISEIYDTRGRRILLEKNRGRPHVVLSDRETLRRLSSKLQFSGKTKRLGSARISAVGETIPVTVRSMSDGSTDFVVHASKILYGNGSRGSADKFYCFLSSDFYGELRIAIDTELQKQDANHEVK